MRNFSLDERIRLFAPSHVFLSHISEERIDELSQISSEPDFWNDSGKAQKILQELNALKNHVEQVESLERHESELSGFLEMAISENADDLLDEISLGINALDKGVSSLELSTMLSGEFDRFNVYLTIHPGAGGKLRMWKTERFAEIAVRLKKTFSANIILIGGPNENELVARVEKAMGFSASIKSTSLSLLHMAALLRRCDLFIGNDSAPGHIAAAVNCPTLSLFGPTFPHMWRPINPDGDVIFKNLPCCACKQRECVRPLENCMDSIGVDEVWEKTEKMINRVSK